MKKHKLVYYFCINTNKDCIHTISFAEGLNSLANIHVEIRVWRYFIVHASLCVLKPLHPPFLKPV